MGYVFAGLQIGLLLIGAAIVIFVKDEMTIGPITIKRNKRETD
jgi:hypothetical protein